MGDQRMMSFGFSGSPPLFWQIKYDDDDDLQRRKGGKFDIRTGQPKVSLCNWLLF